MCIPEVLNECSPCPGRGQRAQKHKERTEEELGRKRVRREVRKVPGTQEVPTCVHPSARREQKVRKEKKPRGKKRPG